MSQGTSSTTQANGRCRESFVASNNQALLEDRFMEYFNGFDSNVKEIIEKNCVRRYGTELQNNVMVSVLEKKNINLTPVGKLDPDGRTMQPLSKYGLCV